MSVYGGVRGRKMKKYGSPLAEILTNTAEDILAGSVFASDPVADSGTEDVERAGGLDWWA